MDPVATSFIVFFALFLGGFLILITLGCIIHCCCAVDIPRYHSEVTDEAIICSHLTKKERVTVIEKVFSKYDPLGRSNHNSEISDDEEDNRTYEEKVCTICLEQIDDCNNNYTHPKSNKFRISQDKDGMLSMEEHGEGQINSHSIIKGWNCNHIYHKECIKPWLEQGKLTCPCCRRDMLNSNDFRTAVLSVLKKERIQMLHRWGIDEEWTNRNNNDNEV